MKDTNRKQSMIVQVDVSAMTPTQRKDLLQDIIDSNGMNCDCITKDIYVFDEKKKDEMLTLIKAGKGSCKGGFPKRWVIADSKALSKSTEPSILDRDNKKYVKLTEEHLATSDKVFKTVENREVTAKFLDSMLLKPLKAWIKARGIADVVDLRLKKADIIDNVLDVLGRG
jgi:hypothetical protein